MIIRFSAELGYKGPCNAFILSKNLSSALKDPDIIEKKKLLEALTLGWVIQVPNPQKPFTSPKHDGGFQRIHQLSHPKGVLVNDNISDGAGEMRYARF